MRFRVDRDGLRLASGPLNEGGQVFRALRDRDGEVTSQEREGVVLQSPITSARVFATRSACDLRARSSCVTSAMVLTVYSRTSP